MIVLRIAGFDGLYGQDSYEYLRYANAIQEYVTDGVHPGNYFWPVLYPVLGGFLGFLFGSTAFALQFISCLSFSVACVYILKTIRLLYPNAQHRFLYVLIFATFCPFVLKMGLIVMSDALTLVFVVLAFYFFFKSYQKNTNLAPIFIFATCALMTRYASLFITFPVIVYALYLVWKRKQFVQLLMAILGSFIVSIPFIIFQWGALFEATSNPFLQTWSIRNFFKSSFTTGDGTTRYSFPNLIYTLYVFFHPGFIFLGSILSVIAIRNYKLLLVFHQKILLICSGLYILFLAGIPFQNPRIIGLVFPLILILLFPAFVRLIQFKYTRQLFISIGIFFVALQIFFFSITFKQIFERTRIEKELATMIQPYEGKTLYSFDVDLAMKGRGLNFDFKNMFLERYENFQRNDLILFDPARYQTQWNDKNPMLNWEFISQNYQLKVLETHSEGWKLYQIQSKK
ncbi:dolichyl-phosphate-mannose-protein mannosyltransferase [Kordia sp. SMS9]|uniref:ArnT family glycosyltransferase n=1 Tax=Kordia sp. SMS9 TaxID=2282170 RepID=UPI000E0D045A|nr:glycosyltransferase family 39 protein [Kordia sp. SMS9]AXG69444.1 dolichyl-phosphate-mannose-protein mannosyltransferase [Kordia sp. SMS9]